MSYFENEAIRERWADCPDCGHLTTVHIANFCPVIGCKCGNMPAKPRTLLELSDLPRVHEMLVLCPQCNAALTVEGIHAYELGPDERALLEKKMLDAHQCEVR